ncbi:hypothetical protein BV20DRAFT_1017659 [Pilatotrama ljubarskyi]|nr:hypothetical protein BV20DRAFT_1017659 [Pilatotrama ljubarskyi]
MSCDSTQDSEQPPLASTDGAPQGASSSAAVTKNGNTSKMRSHRGNIPTLPQTKLCPLCPAKFTRTTHLNRHMKTHTNERLYECDRCHAQFTRSDLLSRHKRSCCASSLANRSRRKSCQSCADSKVKCDLQQPCSRCKARNRDCVYVNAAPAVSEENSAVPSNSSPEAAQTESPTDSSSQTQGDSPKESSPTAHNSDGAQSCSSLPESSAVAPVLAPFSTSADVSSEDPSPNQPSDVLPDPTFPPSSLVPTSELLTVSSGQSTQERSYLSELFSSQMYDDLFSDLFTSSFDKNPTIPGQHFHADSTNVLIDRLMMTGIGPVPSGDVFYDAPAQLAIYDSAPPNPSYSLDGFGSFLPNEAPQPSIPKPIPTGQPSPAELNQYFIHFITTFAWHSPVIHLPTLLQEPRLPVLLTAMQACGAMYARTPTADKFIDSVLATARDEIIADLSSNNKSYDEITQLTQASTLIQTIGLFHRDPAQRAKSNVYHGMTVMMLRMCGYVTKTRDWKYEDIDFTDPAAVERAWQRWVRHESAKRAIWLCYLHDCVHAIYFNLSPTFRTEQFTLGFPSEDGLWTAKNATEWAMLLQTPSPYGSIEVRLCGLYLKALYFYLTQNNPDNGPRPFNVSPFAHFIMIHAMMRKLFEMYLRDRLHFAQVDSDGAGGARPKINPHFVDRDRAFHVQILLHYWLQSWQNSPETPRDVPEQQQRFCFNALPFYWLAQVGLVAYQEGLPPFDPDGTYITSHDAKFALIKKWERHIRKFLASGEQTPTKFWDEVMKIRIESWQAETGFEYEHLLGYFQRND